MRRYLIVGTGAAGMTAAESIRSQDRGGEILLISEDPHGYYSRPGLAYFLTGEIPEKQLFPFSKADFSALDLRWLLARAKCIDPLGHQVETNDGRRLIYDRLLIATGSNAARARVPGADLKGVIKLDTLEDAIGIIKLARRGSRAVVVGGGITALELVEGLRSRNVHTTYFLRGERYWSNVLDPVESSIIEHRLKEEQVDIQYRTELDEILGQRGQVSGVRTKDGRIFPCGLVAVAIGVQPQKELAVASGLKTEKGIVVDQYLQTSAPDVFAAGDVAQGIDPITGQPVLDTLWGPARDAGRIAGLNMAGRMSVYQKAPAFNVTRLAGLTTTIIGQVGGGKDEDLLGIARGDSEIWRQLPDAIAAQANFEVNRLRILVGKERLLGAIVMGDQTLSFPLQHLIRHPANISTIREDLLAPGAVLAHLIAGFWTQWRNDANPASRPSQ